MGKENEDKAVINARDVLMFGLVNQEIRQR